MKKMIILAFLTILPFFALNFYSFGLLYTIPIVLVLFYSLIDYRYPFLFFPAILVFRDIYPLSLAILTFACGLSVILRMYYLKDRPKMIFSTIVSVLILNFIQMLFLGDINLFVLLITTALSGVLMYGFIYTTEIYQSVKEIQYRINNHYLLHLLLSMILVIGSIGLPLLPEVTFFVILLVILYFSFFEKPEAAFIFSIIGLGAYFYYWETPEISLLFPLAALIFYRKHFFTGYIAALLLVVDFFLFNFIPEDYALIAVGAIMLFELIKPILNLFPLFHHNDEILPISENLINNFSDQILKFASFLDDFAKNFIQPIDEKAKINEAFSTLTNTYCHKCPTRFNCFGKAKTETYLFLKNCLLHGQNIHIKKNQEIHEFMRHCQYSEVIIDKAHALKNKYNLFKSYGTFEKTLETQLTGVSNTLRQYVVDLSMKEEIAIFKFSRLKNQLSLLGYQLILYNIKKAFFDDFWLEIGIENIDELQVKTIIKNLITEILKTDVSVEIKKTQASSVLYFSVIPKLKLHISYGYGSLAKDNISIKGDNYLIKDLENGTFISAISDGMGSGYKAYTESKLTIGMIDKITEFEINTSTSLNILNTFYSLKDSFDNYATLDLLEINKSSREAILYKMGSTNTYVAQGNEIKTIVNTNLPFGISDLIKYDKLTLHDQDLIVMATDGIIDNLREDLLKETLRISKHKEPQQIVCDILTLITREQNNNIKDDMTIVVLKAEERF